MPDSGYRGLSLWHETVDDDLTPRPRLSGEIDVDVAIVGAGYTGLWTAYHLLAADPSIRVAVIEAEIAGFGASGRNGGWCSALFPTSLRRMAAEGGRDGAVRLQRQLHDTVSEVGRIADREGIDCHFDQGGTSRSPATPPSSNVSGPRSPSTPPGGSETNTTDSSARPRWPRSRRWRERSAGPSPRTVRPSTRPVSCADWRGRSNVAAG